MQQEKYAVTLTYLPYRFENSFNYERRAGRLLAHIGCIDHNKNLTARYGSACLFSLALSSAFFTKLTHADMDGREIEFVKDALDVLRLSAVNSDELPVIVGKWLQLERQRDAALQKYEPKNETAEEAQRPKLELAVSRFSQLTAELAGASHLVEAHHRASYHNLLSKVQEACANALS